MTVFGGRLDDGRSSFSVNPRLMIALLIAAVSLLGYCANTQVNPVTGKKQHISMSIKDEVAMGFQSAPEMAQQFGGLTRDARKDAIVDQVGAKLVRALPDEYPDYPYEFNVLADAKTVNAFALPGGPIFITEALLNRLETEGQLAGVLGHEMGHVLGRHSAERMSKAKLASGLVSATGVAGSGSYGGAQAGQAIAGQVASFLLLKYGRGDELESDRLGVRFMAAAGYDPRSLIDVMRILKEASGGEGRKGQPEFMSTHPDPGNRAERIKEEIQALFPKGVPEGLQR
jgi:beta-barrel assembly-enhancing protease